MIQFEVIKKHHLSSARLGVLTTPHGKINTPAFIFCGTKATVKSILPQQLYSTNTQVILSNTYSAIFTVGKGSDYKDNIRDFFKLIYEVVFGQENGPRLGSFTKIYTKDKTIELINI